MSNIDQTVRTALAAVSGKKLAVAVSGGRDSMCLLHAVLACRELAGGITVVHVNHGLRDTAGRDEAFVREYCARAGVAFRCFSVDVRALAAAGRTVEQAARELRYGALRDMLKSGDADFVLTAHHALDNAESVLMHIFRGSGLDGLRPMSSPQILRPLLGVYPSELDEYARACGIEYVTDETNFNDDADRNFLRLNVIPLIESRYRGAVRAINALADESADVCALLDGSLDEDMIRYSDGVCVIDCAALFGPLGARYVRRALSHFTLTDMTRDMIQNTVRLARGRQGAVVELAHGVQAMRDYDGVAVYIPRERYTGETPALLGVNHIDGLAVCIERTDASPHSIKGGVVDLGALDGAVVRFRRDGDVFTPFGGPEKKLRRYFIDRKVPNRLRDRIPLIARGSEVLAVVGIEISDKVKVTAQTVTRAAVRLLW